MLYSYQNLLVPLSCESVLVVYSVSKVDDDGDDHYHDDDHDEDDYDHDNDVEKYSQIPVFSNLLGSQPYL